MSCRTTCCARTSLQPQLNKARIRPRFPSLERHYWLVGSSIKAPTEHPAAAPALSLQSAHDGTFFLYLK